MIIAGGQWCDVTVRPGGRPALVYNTADSLEAVELERDDIGRARLGASIFSIDVSGIRSPLHYTRAAADGAGRIGVVAQPHQAGDAVLYLEGHGFVKDLGPIVGVACCEIRGLAEGWEVYLFREGRYEVHTFGPAGDLRGSHGEWSPSSQGFLSADYGPVLSDMGRFYAPRPGAAVLMLPESVDGDVWVGQHPEDPPRIAAARVVNEHVERAVLFALGGFGLPHVARTPDGRLWVCSIAPGASWVESWADADALPWGNDVRTPIPTPGPAPDPKPPIVTPPKETGMQLPDAVKASRDRFVARFPVPQGVPGDAIEEEARQWSRRLSQQVQFDTGDARYGMKNAGGGRPTSKDTLAFDLGGGRIRIWDLISGAGTGHGALVSDPQSVDITGQVFEPQPAINHVGGATQPGTDPGTPTNPGPVPLPPNADVLTMLAVINAKQDEILAKLAQPFKLEARL